MQLIANKPWLVVVMVYCAFLASIQPAQAATVTGPDTGTSLHLSYAEDPEGAWTIDDVIQFARKGQFIELNDTVPQLPDRSKIYWVKILLTLPHDDHWYLYVNYPHLREISLYQPTSTAYGPPQTLGYQFAHNKPKDVPGYAFELNLVPQTENTLYLKISSDSPLIIPISVMTGKQLTHTARLISSIEGIFYGVFGVMALYNLFVFITTGSKSYLFYVLYISSILIFTLSNDGTLREMLMEPDSYWASYSIHMLTALAPILFGAQFCRHFLNTAEILPTHDLLLKLCMGLALFNMLIILALGYNPLPKSIMVLTPAFACIALASGINGIQRGVHTARYFIVAWLCLISGSLTWVSTLLDVLPFNTLTMFSVHLGACAEAVLLAMALGDRIKHLEMDKLRIEQNSKQLLEDTNKRLEASNKFKDEFLSTISHELRTPMNGIFGAVELLEFTHLTEEQARYSNTITKAGRDMLHMVEDILTYTQIEAGSLVVNKERFDLRDLLNKVIIRFKGKTIQKNLKFKTQIDPGIPNTVIGDRQKTLILLDHLLDNATKFTDEGSVTFSVTQSETDNCLEFRIQDTGCGIPSDMKELVFESFRQLDGTMTRSKGGLGIGLAICKRITEILKGDLSIESAESKGTLVTLTLKFEGTPTAPQPASSKTRNTAVYQNQKVLVVEDNYVNKLVLETLLKKMGLQVHSATNGKEAVELLGRETDIQLVFMDCQMPVMDGFEATENIRQLENQNAGVPIIAVTANANQGDRDRCLEAGMNDYVKKPISQSVIEEKLQAWLPSQP